MDRNRGGDTHANRYYVALRKESVDRNPRDCIVYPRNGKSLSARRAWIEMDPVTDKAWALEVALRKESVDRNMGVGTTRDRRGGRSPQGERG